MCSLHRRELAGVMNVPEEAVQVNKFEKSIWQALNLQPVPGTGQLCPRHLQVSVLYCLF